MDIHARPVEDADSRPWWNAVRDHTLLVQRCNACREAYLYPRLLCPSCWSDDVAWEEATGRGEIYSFTVSRRPASPSFEAAVPYVVALVDLDEGPRMMCNVATDPSLDAVHIGARVTVAFRDVDRDLTLPYFVLDRARA